MTVEAFIVPELPKPRLARVENLTPFPHARLQKMGPGRLYYDLLVLKGTFTLAEGRLERAPGPGQIEYADRWHDPSRATRSSLRVAGDAILSKPSADLFVTGHVHAPNGVSEGLWDVGVVVTSEDWTHDYGARVCGPRSWSFRALRGWVLSDPEPVERVPIRYELAFGGVHGAEDEEQLHRPNPSGTGFLDRRAVDRSRDCRAPQWTSPAQAEPELGEVLELAGLGPVARSWSSRLQYAGTYDDAWLDRTRREARSGLSPDYPPDFDARFFQCAHPSLVAPTALRGNERVGLLGMVAGHPKLTFELPNEQPLIHFRSRRGGWRIARMALDTLHVDLDTMSVNLTWRSTIPHALDVGAAILQLEG